jgi:hypothetical protein
MGEEMMIVDAHLPPLEKSLKKLDLFAASFS